IGRSQAVIPSPAMQSAKAVLERANKDLGRTAIIAPMGGVVSLLNVKKGERVVGSNMMAGTEMLRIADMSKIEVRVDVGENDVPKVKIGDKAVVTIDAYSERKFTGVVMQIASSNTGAAQTSQLTTGNDVTQYKVYIRLDTSSYADLVGKRGSFPFRPGMNASADIQTETHIDVLSVPINAVTTREVADTLASKPSPSEAGAPAKTDDDLEVVVFVVDSENKVKKVKVETSIQDLNYIEITRGLKEGDVVVSGPYDVVSKTLKDDSEVKVVERKDLFEKKKD
ncbi:MAG: HlyD family efflux transporter periplasmic adaptor subunit, partial [Pedobacter sp.]